MYLKETQIADKIRPMSARSGLKKAPPIPSGSGGGASSGVGGAPSTAGPSLAGGAGIKTGGIKAPQVKTTGGKLGPGSIRTAMGNARKSVVPGMIGQVRVFKQFKRWRNSCFEIEFSFF